MMSGMDSWDHIIIGKTLDDSDERLQSIILNGETVYMLCCDLTDAPMFADYVIWSMPHVTI